EVGLCTKASHGLTWGDAVSGVLVGAFLRRVRVAGERGLDGRAAWRAENAAAPRLRVPAEGTGPLPRPGRGPAVAEAAAGTPALPPVARGAEHRVAGREALAHQPAVEVDAALLAAEQLPAVPAAVTAG